MENRIHISLENWKKLGKRLYGDNLENYRFKCPKCGNVATGKEFKDVGSNRSDIYQCCIGRFVRGKGCDWAAFGLFNICKVQVITDDGDIVPVFEFADANEEDYIKYGGYYEKQNS